jgi:hypothetical protein
MVLAYGFPRHLSGAIKNKNKNVLIVFLLNFKESRGGKYQLSVR